MTHHAEEEENEMLPQAEESELDWKSLESRVMKRREALMAKASSRAKGHVPCPHREPPIRPNNSSSLHYSAQ